MKKILLIFAILFLGFAVYFLVIYKQNAKTKTLQIGNTKIFVELATSEQQRAKGLSGRQNMPKDHGMLFLFPTAQYAEFWMKDMLFPIDFIWIDGDKIVDLTTNVPPPKLGEYTPIYRPRDPVDKVLEVNADFVFFYQIKVGDKVVLLK